MNPAPMHPLEAILRYCAEAGGQPWYPSAHARRTGQPRELLDPDIDRLRLGGLIQLTEWVPDYGQGYVLTPLGREVLNNPRALARLREGYLPKPSPALPATADDDLAGTTYERGEAVRAALLTPGRPTWTRALIAANVGLFIAGLGLAYAWGLPPDQYLTGNAEQVLRWFGAVDASALVRREWWRLLAAGFVHIGLLHLACNMFALLVIGPPVERMWGPGRFLLLYLIANLGGNCLAMAYQPVHLTPDGKPHLVLLAGASAAICGLLAAMGVWLLMNRSFLPPELFSAVMGSVVKNFILIGLISLMPGVSGVGHLGGAVAGGVAAVFLNIQAFGRGWLRLLGMVGALGVPVLGVVGLLRAMDGSSAWQEVRERQHARQQWEQHREQATISSREVAEFNKRLMPSLQATLGETRRVVEQVEPLINQHPSRRDGQKTQAALQALRGQQAALVQTATTLRAAGPFRSQTAQNARETALQYVEALEKLAGLLAAALEKGTSWNSADQQRLEEQVRQVEEWQQRWDALLVK
ncbi:MAG: rhomboid family intramembrane serine protease [Gemmataceae bacterium]|nr:rhomboid family intramembrane serine protease [Gemmataceae bacterium]MDW8266792.1 rhomboid family intramembrane serine protease [Gemmataceae bacterium]